MGTRNDYDLPLFREASCAGALVELEFLSNPDGKHELAQPQVQQRVAQALAEAVRHWVLARNAGR